MKSAIEILCIIIKTQERFSEMYLCDDCISRSDFVTLFKCIMRIKLVCLALS